MGEMINFPTNGSEGQGYLAVPPSGEGPGVIVIQEWWGLVPHIEDVCDRFAAAGFVALAPDLYRGRKVTEPDEAGKEMMALQLDRAAKDMSGAVDEVARRSSALKGGVGGFCMGGGRCRRGREGCVGPQGRRGGVLRGWRAGARAGHAARSRRGRVCGVLRTDPL